MLLVLFYLPRADLNLVVQADGPKHFGRGREAGARRIAEVFEQELHSVVTYYPIACIINLDIGLIQLRRIGCANANTIGPKIYKYSVQRKDALRHRLYAVSHQLESKQT